MGKSIQIRVDESMAETLEKVRKKIAEDFKREYNLKEITIHGTLASQIAAAKMNGKQFLNFRIKKKGKNKGFLELI